MCLFMKFSLKMVLVKHFSRDQNKLRKLSEACTETKKNLKDAEFLEPVMNYTK